MNKFLCFLLCLSFALADDKVLCLFDLGNLLSNKENIAATDDAFEYCMHNKMNIGVIVPPEIEDQVLRYLGKTSMGQQASSFVRTEAFQVVSQDDSKGGNEAIKRIIDLYDTKPMCLVIFDSGKHFDSVLDAKKIFLKLEKVCQVVFDQSEKFQPIPTKDKTLSEEPAGSGMVCLFDLDDLLSDSAQRDVARIVQTKKAIIACLKNGYKIAAITAPGKPVATAVSFLTAVLGQQEAKDVFNSEAFQLVHGKDSDLPAIQKIVSFYQIKPDCVIVFDSGKKYTKVGDYKESFAHTEGKCIPQDTMGSKNKEQQQQKDTIQTIPSSVKGVCILDFDGVLHIGAGKFAKESHSVIQVCLKNQFEIATVSHSTSVEFLQRSLNEFMPTVFTAKRLNSEAFQVGPGDKTHMIQRIVKFFDVDPRCVMYFEDAAWNPRNSGVVFTRVNPQTGIRRYDVERAIKQVPEMCFDTAEDSERMETGVDQPPSNAENKKMGTDTSAKDSLQQSRWVPTQSKQTDWFDRKPESSVNWFERQPNYPRKLLFTDPSLDDNFSPDSSSQYSSELNLHSDIFTDLPADFRSPYEPSFQPQPPIFPSKGLCIFDVHGVLRLGKGIMASKAKQSIRYCIDQGFDVGIVTRSSEKSFVKNSLAELMPSVFTPDFLSSGAFQAGSKDRVHMIHKVMRYYSARPECVVYFDDAPREVAYAAGISYVRVSPNNGVVPPQVKKGLEKLPVSCRQVNADRNVGLPSATVEKEQRNTRRSQSNVDNTENMFENMQRFPFEAVIEGGIAIAEHIAEKVNQLAEPHTALCIFNWQGALYLQKSGRLAADMGIAVEMCRNKGMDIGIISTMPGSPALIQQSLMTLDPEYFNQNYFSSAAFQVNREGDNSEYPGQKRIDDVLGFYKIPEENQCVLFFDTVYWPIPSDRVTSIILDPETGITTSAVEKGFEKLGDKCFLSSNSLSTQRQTRTQRQKILHEIMSGNVPHRDEDISLPPLFWDYGPPPLARDSSTKDFAPPLPPMQRSWFAGRVCIFDFDGTLLLNSGTTWSLSEYSKTAIESCIMANMKIAIIYDLPSPPEQAAFNILETAFPLLFTKKFFQSPAFQSNIIDITFVLSSILDYFRADPKCSMMWDNQYSIEAEKLGIVHQFTAPDIGLVKSDYLNAWNKMNTSCKLGNIPGKCPSLKFSEGVIPPMCIEFTDGQACRLKCEYGYLPATGSTSIVCDQGNWTAKPLRCKLDPEVTIPEESTSVFKAENRGVMKQLMGEYPLDMVDKMPKDSLHAKFMPK